MQNHREISRYFKNKYSEWRDRLFVEQIIYLGPNSCLNTNTLHTGIARQQICDLFLSRTEATAS